MLCFALDNKESFDNLTKWLEMFKIKAKNKFVIALVGNKKDKKNEIVIKDKMVDEKIESLK